MTSECVLATYKQGKICGIEDFHNGNANYSYSVVCESKLGCCYELTRDSFVKMVNNPVIASAVQRLVSQNLDKFSEKIVEGALAEDKLQ